MQSGTEGARKLYLEERQQEILSLLDKNSFVRINNLSSHFGVSGATIRKDLRVLEQAGKLRRTHGGAIKPNPNFVETEPRPGITNALEEKVRIAHAAANLVQDKDVLYIHSGSTCLEFARALEGKRQLTVITNDLSVALTADEVLEDETVVLLGGTLRPGFRYTYGSEALKQVKSYYIPTTYMSCSGFSLTDGFAMHKIEDANWVRALLDVSERHIMLCDSTKVGVHALAHAAPVDDVDCLVIGREVCEGARDFLESDAPDLDIIYA